jgi:hypothetical protein
MNFSLYQEVLNYASIAFGLGAMAYAFFMDSPKGKLKETGLEANGIIFTQDRDYKIFRLLNSNNVNDAVTIRFVTEKKEWISGLIDQPFQMFYTWQYKNGEKVKFIMTRTIRQFLFDTKQSNSGQNICCSDWSVLQLSIYSTFYT